MQAGDGAGLRERPPTPTISTTDLRLELAIIRRIGEPRFNLWFRQQTKFVRLDDCMVVGVPNLYFHDWLQATYGDVLQEAVTEVFGDGIGLRFVVDPDLKPPTTGEHGPHKHPRPTVDPRPEPNVPREKLEAAKRRWRNLQDFVVGSSNRVAHAAALNIVEEAGQGPNPLVIHGPTGTGKTHLLEGIYLGLKRRQSSARVMYLTAEDFMNRFLGALHHNKAATFRKQFRDCTALLIDDLNFIARKKATEVEFLHTFDALLAEGCQIVVTLDCHPKYSEEFLPELNDRLLGGAIWGVQPPDEETRRAILRTKSLGLTPHLPEDVVDHIAEHLKGNVRELEGAVHTVRHFSRVAQKPVTIGLAREALAELFRHSMKVVRIPDVESAVCAALNLTPNALRSKSKTWAVSHARMLAIYLCRRVTSASHGEISTYFGNKTHSTAVAAEKRVRNWLSENQFIRAGDREWKARDLIERIERELRR
jgi:chromosomal replication initiator protein